MTSDNGDPKEPTKESRYLYVKDDELEVLELIYQGLLRGADLRVVTRKPGFASMYRKVLALKKRLGSVD